MLWSDLRCFSIDIIDVHENFFLADFFVARRAATVQCFSPKSNDSKSSYCIVLPSEEYFVEQATVRSLSEKNTS